MNKNIREWLVFLLTLVCVLTVCGTLLFLILISLTGLNDQSAVEGRDDPIEREELRKDTACSCVSMK